jgi:adenosine/AMP kinase
VLNLHAVKLRIPENANIVLGQSHFIKTVEDLYESMVNSAPQVRFGVAFNEASGPCLTRVDGNDPELRHAAQEMASAVGAGHFFAVAMREGFPINVLNAITAVPEVCTIFCATANPVEVIVAETEQGRGVLGVIDGSSPKAVETAEQAAQRHEFLRRIGYKR